MILLVGIISGFLTIFINYCMGKPSSEFSPYEIFSFYTIWLSKRRLKKVGTLSIYEKQYNENLRRANTKADIYLLKNDFKKMIYEAAEPFFTWERMIGMCSVCFGFWVSLVCGFWFTKDFIYLLTIVVTSHIVIRLLNKFL